MKKIKTTLLTLSFLGASLCTVMISCDNTSKPEDSEEVAEEHNEAKFDNKEETDAAFLVAAAGINLEEIQLGKLAQTNSANSDVKALGAMMESEHSKVLNPNSAIILGSLFLVS